MPAADLRALAERLQMLKPCEVCEGGGVLYDERGLAEPCRVCEGRYQHLPTEAEVRAAIFEAGVTWVEVGVSPSFAAVMFGGEGEYRARATSDEAAPDELVLLALLRALEACRG